MKIFLRKELIFIISLEHLGFTPSQNEILKEIYLEPGITRKRLAELTGISGRSILKYVAEFLEKEIVINYGTKNSTGGRNAVRLAINPDFLLALAVDIGSYATKIGVVNMHGEIIKDEFISYDKDKGQSLITPAELRSKLSTLISEFGIKRFIGLGMSITGLVDSEKKFIQFAPNIRTFNHIDVVKEFEEPLKIPVCLDASARCLALAEQRHGFGKGVKNQIFISVGHSISAGIIINDHLFSGSCGTAGEIGHVKVASNDIRCTCGNYDCLEIYSTLTMIRGKIATKVFNFHGYSPTANLVANIKDFTLEHVTKGIDLKDKIVMECISEAGKYLGYAVSHMVNALNPDLIVFGGSVTELLPSVIDEAISTINELGLISAIQNLRIEKSNLGYKSAIIGSATQVSNSFFGV